MATSMVLIMLQVYSVNRSADLGPLLLWKQGTPDIGHNGFQEHRVICQQILYPNAHKHGVYTSPSGTSHSSIAYRLLYTVTEQLPTWVYRAIGPLCIFFSMGVFYHQAGDFMTITKKNYRFGFLFYMPAAPG